MIRLSYKYCSVVFIVLLFTIFTIIKSLNNPEKIFYREVVNSSIIFHPFLSGKVNLILVVCSVLRNKERRDVIRSFNSKYQKGISTKLVFVLGKSFVINLDEIAMQEATFNGDMAICSSKESYTNITAKMMCVYRWLASISKSFSYMMKIDDDVYVNTPMLGHYLLSIKNCSNFYGGYTYQGYVPRTGRHAISNHIFSNKTFPKYCKGANYVISSDLFPKLMEAANKIKAFPVEDAYVGVLMHSIGVAPVSIREFAHLDYMAWIVRFISDCSLQYWITLGDGLSASHLETLYQRSVDHEFSFDCLPIKNYIFVVRILMSVFEHLIFYGAMIILTIYILYTFAIYSFWVYRKRFLKYSEPAPKICCTLSG